jgi:hypothetical protein
MSKSKEFIEAVTNYGQQLSDLTVPELLQLRSDAEEEGETAIAQAADELLNDWDRTYGN